MYYPNVGAGPEFCLTFLEMVRDSRYPTKQKHIVTVRIQPDSPKDKTQEIKDYPPEIQ